MKRQEVLDRYFIELRHKLIEVAAFLDRVERAGGEADFRLAAMERALRELGVGGGDRAERALRVLSDPTVEPVAVAPGKGACGAFPLREG
jgi:hypothetical protein